VCICVNTCMCVCVRVCIHVCVCALLCVHYCVCTTVYVCVVLKHVHKHDPAHCIRVGLARTIHTCA